MKLPNYTNNTPSHNLKCFQTNIVRRIAHCAVCSRRDIQYLAYYCINVYMHIVHWWIDALYFIFIAINSTTNLPCGNESLLFYFYFSLFYFFCLHFNLFFSSSFFSSIRFDRRFTYEIMLTFYRVRNNSLWRK